LGVRPSLAARGGRQKRGRSPTTLQCGSCAPCNHPSTLGWGAISRTGPSSDERQSVLWNSNQLASPPRAAVGGGGRGRHPPSPSLARQAGRTRLRSSSPDASIVMPHSSGPEACKEGQISWPVSSPDASIEVPHSPGLDARKEGNSMASGRLHNASCVVAAVNEDAGAPHEL